MIIPIELRFKADKDSKSAFRTDKTIKSHDVNSVEFHITIDGLELTDDHTAKILSVFHSSESQVNVDCEIVDGVIIYKPDTNLISRHEHVTNYVYVYNGNQSLDVREFIYTVDLSKIDETSLKVKEVYDQSYANLLADFEQALSDYKDNLPQADSVRADIDEILNQYDADAQQAISDNQTAFDLAESVRQDSYEQAESERNQLSNQAVVDWGQGADALLETVEGNESARVDAEAGRVEKESERVQAETERIQAEQARKEAEILREESYEQKVDTAIVEADIVEKVDNKVTELTPGMNDLTAQLAQTDSKKVDKDGSQQVKWANIAQDAREQISGDKVSVVGKDSVGTENLTENAVTYDKLSPELRDRYLNDLNIQHIENELKNGRFTIDSDDDGVGDGWVLRAKAHSPRVENGVQYWVRGSLSGPGNQDALAYQPKVPLIKGNKYYLSFYSENIDRWRWYYPQSIQEYILSSTDEDGFYSTIIQSDLNVDILSFIPFEPEVETALGSVVLINLTELYGLGNEPTKEELDIILKGFDNRHFEDRKYLFDGTRLPKQLETVDKRLEIVESKIDNVNPNVPDVLDKSALEKYINRDTKLNFRNIESFVSFENANEWSVTNGNIQTVEEIDTSDYGAEYEHGYTGYIPRWGETMIRCDFTTESVLHKPLIISKEKNENLVLSVFIEDSGLSEAKDGPVSISIRFHSNYPNVDGSYFEYVIYKSSIIPGKWNYLTYNTAGSKGTPSWDAINGISVHFGSEVPARVYIGGIYKYDSHNTKGAILLDFDDSLKTFYTEAFQYMTLKKGYRGNVAVIPEFVENGMMPSGLETMSVAEHINLQDAGWSMANHTFNHTNTIGNEASIEEKIGTADVWMRERGLNPVAFVPPGNRVNRLTTNVASKYYDISRGRTTMYLTLPLPEIMNIGSLEMNDSRTIEWWEGTLQQIEDDKSVRSFHFHEIGDTGYGNVPVTKFRQFIDAIERYNVQVLTYQDILDGKWV